MTRPQSFIACLLGLGLLMLAVGGCANNGTAEPTDPSGILVSYQRSGGFAGLHDELVIYDDGRCQLQRRRSEREFTLQPNQLAHLKALLQEANFFALNEEYLRLRPGADLFQYSITYQAGGKKHTVHTEDLAVPDALQPVLDELNQLISSNS